MADTRITGKIIDLSKSGWGFISSRDIEFTKIFFHWTSLVQGTTPFPGLRVGMMVEFTPLKIEGRGWRAMHVRVLPKIEDKTDEVVLPAL